jgi:jumonji domain-containing protein 7
VTNVLGRDVFVEPEESRMTFPEFLRLLQTSTDVAYVSAQNGNLHSDFASVADDVPQALEFATHCFGTEPDAVNIWIGDSRSVTTFHSDNYENVYAVIRGSKTLTLLPPWDVHRLRRADVPVGRYIKDTNTGWRVALHGDVRIRWATAEPKDLGDGPPPLTVTLHAGDVLYLPALWAHHVCQTDGTIAVNWWHDMRYGSSYAMHRFLQRLSDEMVK